MAKVKCEFCGSFIEDTESICPQCGGVNENHRRIVDGTPKTIEQLQQWYKSRGLPPEEVTRFFIGKDIKEPKAFGIYEEFGTFVVYKNKADGTRAVRYKGTDEAYAVNELYLRLKEEILNQKAHNIEKRGIGNRPGASVYRPTSGNRRSKKVKTALITTFIVLFLFPTIISTLISTISFSNLLYSEHGYYVTNTSEVYYSNGQEFDGKYEWWLYDQSEDEWELHSKLNRKKQKPEALKDESNYTLYTSYFDVTQALSIESDKFPIEDAKEYIDAGHHQNPMSAYYYHDDKLYYFLNDKYSDYGNSDNTGWYVYNTSSSDWEYYCDADDKSAIGDDLWYNQSDYCAGTSYDGMYRADEYLKTWSPTDFESTSWYRSYESNEAAYQRDLDSDNSNDSDSDYDWDSGDSWDSGDTNWDSDW